MGVGRLGQGGGEVDRLVLAQREPPHAEARRRLAQLDAVVGLELERDLLHAEDPRLLDVLVVAQALDEPHGIVQALGLVVAGSPFGTLEDHHVGHACLLPVGCATVAEAVSMDRPDATPTLSSSTHENGYSGPRRWSDRPISTPFDLTSAGGHPHRAHCVDDRDRGRPPASGRRRRPSRR